jgi:hypothetical protein
VATASAHELLERFQPSLRYDSLETYFADSAEEWTASPDNALRRADGGPVAAGAGLTLDFLGSEYGDGHKAAAGDVIEAKSQDYSLRYRELRETRPELRNMIYGRAVPEGGGLWLQYWFFYFLNDYQLAWGIDVHEGDWEMVQLHVPEGADEPDEACYAQHTFCELRPWPNVLRDGDRPLVFVGRGSHASFFEDGYHPTDFYDICDGKQTPKKPIELVDVTDAPRWLQWPGHWGGKRTGYAGPSAPCRHDQWDGPRSLLGTAREVPRRNYPGAPHIEVKKRRGRLVVHFDASRAERPLKRLIVTVNSSDEKLTPPRPFRFALSGVLAGRLATNIELAREKHYDVWVATTDLADQPTAAQVFVFEPVSWLTGLQRRVSSGFGRLVYRVRRVFGVNGD